MSWNAYSIQLPDGVFSTWGERGPDGQRTWVAPSGNWYNANFRACVALYQLDAYVRSLAGKSNG